MKHVVYVRSLAHASYGDLIATRADVTLDYLPDDAPVESIREHLSRVHVYQVSSARDDIGERHHVTGALLARAPNLLAVSTNGAGYDTVDVEACTRLGVLAVNQRGGNKQAVSEHVIGMMLCLSKQIARSDRAMRRQPNIDKAMFIGHDIHGKTLGIVGLGEIGRQVASLARAFGMSVVANDPYVDAAAMVAAGCEKVSLDALLVRSDFVSINCPLTPETRGLIGDREYGLMKPSAYFISTARGGIHDEAALARALADRRLAGAGLDVWSHEPPPPDHALLGLDTVVASPHIAGVTHEARRHIGAIAAEQVLTILDGGVPPRLINPEVLPAYGVRFQRIMGRRKPR